MHDNLLRESHKLYGLPNSVTWLQLLCRQTNTGRCAALTAKTRWPTRTRLRAPPLWYQPRLATVTYAWSWSLCGNNPAIGLYTRRPTVNRNCKEAPCMKAGKAHPRHWTVCAASCSNYYTPRRDSSISTAQEARWTPELVFHSAAHTEIRFAYKNLQ